MIATHENPDYNTLSYVHFESTPIISGITGRTILLNEHNSKFSVLPGLSSAAVAAAYGEWQECLMDELTARLATRTASTKGISPGLPSLGVSGAVQKLVNSCLTAKTAADFAVALNALVPHAYWPSKAPGAKGSTNNRIVHLLVLLWKHGALAFPSGLIWRPGQHKLPSITVRNYGSLSESLHHLFTRTPAFLRAYEGAKDRDGERSLRYLLLACGKIIEVGDVDNSTLERLIVHLPRPPKGANALLCDALRALQLLAYDSRPEILRRVPPTYRPALSVLSRRELAIHRFDHESEVLPSDPSWVHMEPTPVTSSITGRTLFVNYDKIKYAVLPHFSLERLAAARSDWESEATSMGRANPPLPALAVIAACFRSRTSQGLAVAIERLVTHRMQKVKQYCDGRVSGERRAGEATRLTEALLFLWKHDLIAFPAGELWGTATVRFGGMGKLDEHFYGPLAPAILTMEGNTRWGAAGRRIPRLIFLICGGVREVGDLDEAVLSGLVDLAGAAEKKLGHRKFPSSVNVLCDRLRALQLQAYAEDEARLTLIPQSYRTIFRPKDPGRADPDFKWATTLGPRIASWRKCAAAYIASLPNRVTRRAEITTLNIVLDYVYSHKDIPGNPVTYCNRKFSPEINIESYFLDRKLSERHYNNTLRKVGLFFRWLLEQEAMDEDGDIAPEFYNPLEPDDLSSTTDNRGQTHRMAVPIRYLRMMREIIEENDYEWPRSLAQDYVEWLNPETGVIENVWSPVRAFFYLLRLHLPLRGMQVRLLDSGEGDPEVFRPDQGGWVRNTNRWTPDPASKKKPMGFVRRIWDHQLSKPFNGLYITTNKTADRAAGFIESGYEIPWENPDAIALFVALRDWQEKYNPSQKPLTRSELSDVGLSASADVAMRLEKLHFLFRDPSNAAYPMEPISVGRLSSFWLGLVAELERRLASRGITSHDGSPITLITKYAEGRPAGTIFDPHSLRVAGLTAFAAAGVPIHVLSEFVAGHATVLMTIYYQKLGASEVTRLLDEASLRMLELEQRQWAAFLKDQPLDAIADFTVFNSVEAAGAARAIQSGLWSPLDDGICPNGGTKCAVGGPLVDGRRKVYAPVPGGARNCPLCRFFVTSPAFLGGLAAKFNATAAAILEAIARVQAVGAKRRELVRAQLEAARSLQPFSGQRQLARAEEELTKSEDEVDVLSQSWMGQLRLIERCKALLDKRKALLPSGRQTNALVLNGMISDLRVSLESCSNFDLWDRICEESEFFEGTDARVPALRRGRLFDAMLAREGRPALFATLTDDQIISVGNEVTRLLRTQLGDGNLNDLLAGQKTLKELGAQELIDRTIAITSKSPVTASLATLMAQPQRIAPAVAGGLAPA